MQLPRILAAFVSLGLGSSVALAEDASPSSHKFLLTPRIGVTSESAFVDGAVRFSDGDIDFISIVPDAGLLLGLELGYRFRPGLTGVLGLSYATANARYIEDNDLRPDAKLATIRIQPGVMANIVSAGAIDLALGGGLTIAQVSLDDLVWNDARFGSSALAIGLFGAAGLDVALSQRASFYTRLVLEATRPTYGDLEEDLARADNELDSRVDHDMRFAALLMIGVSFGL